jgi:hypothetical protein
MKKLIFIAFLLVLLLLFIGYSCIETHESHSLEQVNFFLEKPYIAVVKGLATKNSLEKIVEENDGIVANKNWENFTVEVPQRILRLREYKLEGTLKFTVQKNDQDLGKLELPFVQKINLDNHVFSLKTSLVEPQKHVLMYEKTMEMSPALEQNSIQGTHVSIRSELKVKKTIPFFFRNIMDERVAQANKKDAERLKNNIINSSSQKTTLTITRH